MNEMCCASSSKPPHSPMNESDVRNFYSYLTSHLNNCRTNAPPNAKSNETHLLFAFLALARRRRSRRHCVGARSTASALGKLYLRRDEAQTTPSTAETNDSLECGFARVLEYHFLGKFAVRSHSLSTCNKSFAETSSGSPSLRWRSLFKWNSMFHFASFPFTFRSATAHFRISTDNFGKSNGT